MLPRLRSVRPTRRTGRESAIVFINATRGDVTIDWLAFEGEVRSYGSISPGERYRQHTYGGHRWLVRDASGAAIGVYEADEVPRNVAITIDPKFELLEQAPPPHRASYPSPDGRKRFEFRREPVKPRRIRHPKRGLIPYPKPGDPIDGLRPRLFVDDREIPIDGDFPSPWELTDVRWSPDSERVTFIYNQRGHQRICLVAVEARSGRVTHLIDERSDTFVDYASKLYCHFVGDAVLWMSERDGHNHLYLFEATTGALRRQLTRGPYCVRRVEHVDEEQVFFVASGFHASEDPYHEHLFRIPLDGGSPVQLTAGDGTHEIELSADRKSFIDRWSRIDRAPVTELRSAVDGALLQAPAPSAITIDNPARRFVAKGRDGTTDIHGILILPSNFDPQQRYPVVEEIYAGPSDQHVPKAYEALERQRAIADRGFVVVMIDGMGTNWRSKSFHDVAYQNIEDAGFPDRKRWIRAAAATRPWMDLSRVGIYGGSAGGQSAVRALIDHHDLYGVAVADCGCHDNRVDKMWWNELWLGYPVGEAYERASNIAHAHRLEGELLLIVGALDDNVDPACTFELADALRRAGKRFELEVIDDAGHGAAETHRGGQMRLAFLEKHLL